MGWGLGDWAWLNAIQLAVAGMSLMLAAHQLSVLRWEGRRSPAGLVIPPVLATAGVAVTNFAALSVAGSPGAIDWWLLARSVLLGLLTISLFPLAGYIARRPPPRLLMVPLAAVITARLILWPTTSLVYRHRLEHGLPTYGPLTAPSGLLIVAAVFGYLCWTAWRAPSERERVVLTTGILASLALAVASLLLPEGVAAEMATGYLPLPSLVALTLLLWLRQGNAFRTISQLAERQRTLADLGRAALTADLSTVRAAASQAVTKHQDSTGEFVLAVDAVVAAAAAQDEARRVLHRRATVDDLTGLPNRFGLLSLINQALDRVRQEGTALAVAFCDIDRLRVINDVYGHAVGDEVLEIVAARLVRAVRPPEFVGRFGGDVFVIVQPGRNDSSETAELGQRLADVFARPISTSQSDTDLSASIGIATVTAEATGEVNAETLLRDADTALNDAKARGGTAIGRFDATLRSTVVYRADLERRLGSAVARGQITVHYQPIVDLATRIVIGFEALARWNDAGTLMLPAEWIPVAEATGLINDIGEEVLRQAVSQLRVWTAAGHNIGVSVNVSARQLATRRFYDAVRSVVADQVAPGALTLEVTESLALDDQAIDLLKDLRRHGLRVALDDFGTGFSALAAVSRLPVDCLKIDQSIVRRVDELDGQAITSAAIGIARALNLSTVAEGIETAEAAQTLTRLGCDLGQGYFYGRPTGAEPATRMLVGQGQNPARPRSARPRDGRPALEGAPGRMTM